MENTFSGFTPDSFTFFRELARNNNKAWFDAHRARYEAHVQGVFRALLVTLEPALLRLNPDFETSGKTNGNFSRINRDIRFSKDKIPYKSNYYVYFFDRRRKRAADGRLYVGLSVDCVTVGFSIYATWGKGPKGVLETVFRPRFEKERAAVLRLVERVVKPRRYETYWHRQEKGEWTLHPGLPKEDEDWLSMEAWIVRRVFEADTKSLATSAFARQVEKIFAELYPLYALTSVAGARWNAAVLRR